ncbi:MAG: MFS transporter [Myxococcales bacterium]|nr:MFS transporter [Myxococcales bacterium]HRC54268.1 MFS transporter [Kofleriaceae bacterium]
MVRSPVLILVVLAGLNFLNYLVRMLPSSVLQPMQAELQLSNLASGALATAFLLGYMIGSPLVGAQASKSGRKWIIAAGVVVWSAATVASGLAMGLTTMLAARMVVGLGNAAYSAITPTLVDDLSTPERKGRNLALFYMAVPVGSAFGYLLGGFVEVRWGWRAAFFVGGAPGLALALLCLVIAEPARRHVVQHINVRQAVRALAKIPLYRRALLGYCAHTGALGAVGHWAPKFLVDRYALPLDAANFWFGLVTVVAGFVAILGGGRLADRAVAQMPGAADSHLSADNGAVVAALLRICGVGMWLAVPVVVGSFLVPNATLFFALSFLGQLFLFVAIAPVSSAMMRSVPTELRAASIAIGLFAIHAFGDLWTPALVGALADLAPMATALMLVPALLVVGAWIWWPLRRPQG